MTSRKTGLSRAVAYLPALAWAIVLLHSGGRSDLTKPEAGGIPIDKIAHLITYGLLGLLVARGWRRAGFWPAPVWPIALAITVGVADELHQMTVPGREASGADLLMNGIGVALGFAFVRFRSRPGSSPDES